MKPLLALLGVSMGIVFAVPAHGDPGVDEAPSNDNNGVFLADLQKVGIGSATRTRPSAPAKRYVLASTTACPVFTFSSTSRTTTPHSPKTALPSSRRSRRNRTARDNSTRLKNLAAAKAAAKVASEPPNNWTQRRHTHAGAKPRTLREGALLTSAKFSSARDIPRALVASKFSSTSAKAHTADRRRAGDGGRFGVFVQMAPPKLMRNRTGDEQPIPTDEQ